MANYVLTVKLDPSQLNAQLQKIQNAFGGGGGGQGGAGGQGLKGALGKFQNALNALQQSKSGGLGKAAAVGFMALGIMELVKLVKGLFSMVVDSSPMLKAMMGLLNNSIMFILRPIGDFIGFMLRPILMVFLRYIALPFYKHFYPIMQKYGNTIGEGLASLLLLAIGFFQDPAGALKKAFDGLPDTVRKIIDVVFPMAGIVDLLTHLDVASKAIKDFADLVSGSIIKTIQDGWKAITGVFSSITSSITSVITPAWNTLKGLWSGISTAITSTVTPAWNTLSKFFTSISSTVTSALTPIWNSFSIFFKTINSGLTLILSPVWTALVNAFDWLEGGITLIKDAWGNVVTGFKMMANFFIDIYNGAISWLKNLPGIGGLFSGLQPAKKFGNGGMITEPVIGVGQRSGQGYMFGERGNEMVTPVGRGGGNTINIYVNGGDPIALKKIILETIQESSTRRRKI